MHVYMHHIRYEEELLVVREVLVVQVEKMVEE
jgi:hypothetical protein